MRLLLYIWKEEVHELLSPVRLARNNFRYHTARCQYYDKTLEAIYATAMATSLIIYVALAPSRLLVAHWAPTCGTQTRAMVQASIFSLACESSFTSYAAGMI